MDHQAREFVAPLSIVFEIDGAGVEITPIVVDELFSLLEISDPIFGELLQVDEGTLDRFGAGMPSTADTVWLLRLAARHGEAVMRAVAICSRAHTVDGIPVTGALHEAWVRRLLPDRFVELFTVCMQVNKDFFSRAMPGFRALVSRFMPAQASAGDAADSPSSATGQTPSSS